MVGTQYQSSAIGRNFHFIKFILQGNNILYCDSTATVIIFTCCQYYRCQQCMFLWCKRMDSLFELVYENRIPVAFFMTFNLIV